MILGLETLHILSEFEVPVLKYYTEDGCNKTVILQITIMPNFTYIINPSWHDFYVFNASLIALICTMFWRFKMHSYSILRISQRIGAGQKYRTYSVHFISTSEFYHKSLIFIRLKKSADYTLTFRGGLNHLLTVKKRVPL